MLSRLPASQRASFCGLTSIFSISSVLLAVPFNSATCCYRYDRKHNNPRAVRTLYSFSTSFIATQPFRIHSPMRFSRSKTTYTGMLPNGISPSSYDIPLSSIPQNWKTLAPFPTNPNAQTYKHQPSLPHLPVPPLQHTLSKLKSSVRAMAASDAEYEAAVAKIDRFGASGAIGERLQERLVKRREEEGKEGGRGHWLEEWWDEVGYMGFRDTVSNPHPRRTCSGQALNHAENPRS